MRNGTFDRAPSVTLTADKENVTVQEIGSFPFAVRFEAGGRLGRKKRKKKGARKG